MTKIVIEPKTREDWERAEKKLYEIGYSWERGPLPDVSKLTGFSHNMLHCFDKRQIFVKENMKGWKGTLCHGYYDSRCRAPAPIVSAENFLRYTEKIKSRCDL